MIFLYILGFIALLLLFQVGVALWEKRMVWPYSVLEQNPQFLDPTNYAEVQIAEALNIGFRFLGWAKDIKGPLYRLCYAFLVSSERDSLAIIGVGTIMNMRLSGIWIHTPDANGRNSYYSTNNDAAVEIDISGRWKNQLAKLRHFPDLWNAHRNWLRPKNIHPRGFPPGAEFETFRAVRAEHYENMASRGLLRFLDAERRYWRYTVWGATKIALYGYGIGTARALTGGRFPKTG